ncbi:MAG: enolase C-terminal domain-like protein [Planctomycetaceae bacterium]|jgi:L-Ala-D/L-Glu epimerase|nr:enolase C-terminal domain-like protein [Planctomycetaceae bacterium]
MRISELTCRHVQIPLKRKVKHASHERTSTDSIIVSCRLDNGTVGWGEGLPRDYVTGDTIESSLTLFNSTNWEHLLSSQIDSAAGVVRVVENIHFPMLDENPRDILGNPLRCAVELAILDAVSRSLKFPFRDYFRLIEGVEPLIAPQNKVRYSGIIASSTFKKVKWLCRLYRWAGFRQCKVKVGIEGVDDLELLSLARKALGPNIALRVDANEAWEPQELAVNAKAFEQFQIVSIEQPLRHEAVNQLAKIRPELSIPIMLDESMCSLKDGQRAIDQGLCDLFNIRLSKCGGIVNSVKLAVMAQQAGLGFQLGSQVGETGILSAAGRHFVTTIGGWLAAEGSFDNFLIKERLTEEDLTFWIDGTAKALAGSGLGMTVDTEAVERVTISTHSCAIA